MGRIKGIVLSLLSVFLFSGCLPHTELDNQAIVEAMGIDYSDGKYEVTVQYFNMEGTGGNSPIDSTKANVINVTGKGDSVTSALESASLKCGRPFMYGITSIIILGKEVLNLDIAKTMSFAESYYQNNPAVLIAAAENKASDILNVKFKEGIISVEHLSMILENADYGGITGKVEILGLLSEQRRKCGATILPVLKTIDSGSDSSDDGKSVEIMGGYLISGGHFISELSFSDMSGLQLMRRETRNTLISADFGDERVEITAYDIDVSINHTYKKGKLTFFIHIRSNGKYTDSYLSDKTSSFSQEVEKLCSAEVIERVKNALVNTANLWGCDPCGLKYVISGKNYTEWIRIEENFDNFLKNAEFVISCDMDIDRFGITH